MKKQKNKALVLFSGGLDSMLAVKLLVEQGVETMLVCFTSNFFDSKTAESSARILGLPLRKENISEDFLTVLKKPKHGYGAGLNPCIDCRAFMLKKASEIMRKEGFDFVATGEVLGERPMSQNQRALKIVEKEAGLEGRLLRPLSVKLLEPTIPEKQSLVDREKLLDISGRSRQRQMALAKKYGIKNYPSPGGGCVLTQSGFAARLKKTMENRPDFSADDANLIGVGRHFFYGETWFILGRDKAENEFLKKHKKPADAFVVPLNFAGPEALVRGKKISDEAIKRAKDLIVKFAPKAKNLEEEFIFETVIK